MKWHTQIKKVNAEKNADVHAHANHFRFQEAFLLATELGGFLLKNQTGDFKLREMLHEYLTPPVEAWGQEQN